MLKPQSRKRRSRRLTQAQKFLLLAVGFSAGFIIGTVCTEVLASADLPEISTDSGNAAVAILCGVGIAFLLGIAFYLAEAVRNRHD